MVFFLSFKYVLKHYYLSDKETTPNKSSWLVLLYVWPMTPAPKVLALSPDSSGECVQYLELHLALGFYKKRSLKYES
jgi:hypothetical protein